MPDVHNGFISKQLKAGNTHLSAAFTPKEVVTQQRLANWAARRRKSAVKLSAPQQKLFDEVERRASAASQDSERIS